MSEKDDILKCRTDSFCILHPFGLHLQKLLNDVEIFRTEACRLEIYPGTALGAAHRRTFADDIIIATQMRAIEKAMRFQSKIFSSLSTEICARKIVLSQVLLNFLGHIINLTEPDQAEPCVCSEHSCLSMVMRQQGVKPSSSKLQHASGCDKGSIFWLEQIFLKVVASIVLPTHFSTQSFCPLAAQVVESLSRLAMLSSRQNIQKRAIYPGQQNDRCISFASKIKDSVQEFLEQAIAPLVERYLYPERSL